MTVFGRLSLSKKLLCGFGSIIILLIGVGAVGVWGSAQQSSASSRVTRLGAERSTCDAGEVPDRGILRLSDRRGV